jgi:protein gp37
MNNPIGWCDETWNPMTGCTPVSEACESCWAERMARRFTPRVKCDRCQGAGWEVVEFDRDDDETGGVRTYAKTEPCLECDGAGKVTPYDYFDPTFHPDRLDRPLHWRRPRRIFVNSMSDLFHEAFDDEQIRKVISRAWFAPQHTYIVLTKRPERMHRLLPKIIADTYGAPLPNLWLGVTAENQQRADERIPILLDTPAAVRFVCCEPLLGPVDLDRIMLRGEDGVYLDPICGLDWVILGGETGHGARRMEARWAVDIRKQCRAAGVPFYFKQCGSAWLAGDGTDDEADAEMLNTRELPAVAP